MVRLLLDPRRTAGEAGAHRHPALQHHVLDLLSEILSLLGHRLQGLQVHLDLLDLQVRRSRRRRGRHFLRRNRQSRRRRLQDLQVHLTHWVHQVLRVLLVLRSFLVLLSSS